MARETTTQATAGPRALDAAGAQLLAFAALALVNAIMIVARVPRPPGLGARLFHHAYDAGQMLALGLAASAIIDAWKRWGPARPVFAYLALGALGTAVAVPILAPDLHGAVTTLTGGGNPDRWLAIFLAAAGAVIACAAILGRILARSWLRAIGVAIALVVAIENHLVLDDDYPGVHFYAAWAAATLLGASITGLALPVIADRARRLFTPARAVASLLCATAIAVPPRNAVALDLLRLSGSVVAPELARLRGADLGQPALDTGNRWLLPARPDAPPSRALGAGEAPIVILIVVDCLRADVVHSGKYAARLPAFEALRHESAELAAARSPASGTLWTLSSIFSGRYYSGLYWTVKPGGVSAKEYPHEDLSIRFPELLQKAGVTTSMVTEMPDVLNEYGIVRGFAEEEVFKGKTGFADRVTRFGMKRLMRRDEKPLFLYLHYLEAHAPYDRAGAAGPPFERYLGEVGIVDAEIGRLRRFLADEGLTSRTTMIVTADHGEAFGEHDTTDHGVSVHEELLRVPLLINGPRVKPRRVEQPVSLIDLGPTVLDLFGLPAPGAFLGQSLVPLLEGRDATLDRPLFADTGRWQQALLFPDGRKLIRDQRRGTFELYDLLRDPGEEHNLFDDAPDAPAKLDALRAFFWAEALHRPGYHPPFRP